jgi:hypothetical protein
MNKNTLFAITVAAATVFTACGPEIEVIDRRTKLDDPQGVEPIDPFALSMPPVFATIEDRFVTSAVCRNCHSSSPSATAMRDSEGNSVAPFDLWGATMMGNASRDPLWQAVVSAEIQDAPEALKGDVEAKCMRCHMPMASEATGRQVTREVLTSNQPVGSVARDGVACALCHQISAENLNDDSYFDGGFVIGDEMRIFGPYRNVATGPMQHMTGYTPVYGAQVTDERFCATCHTLLTNAVDDNGNVSGPDFPEQTPYFEWQNSEFADNPSATCQGCHMGYKDDTGSIFATRIARAPNGGDFNVIARSPFGQHFFVGGNTFMTTLIKEMRVILNPQATDAAFDAVIERTRRNLQENTADVEISDLSFEDGVVAFDVSLETKIGHKFPTGFPSRRAWLHTRVLDADGNVLWASGEPNEDGRIIAGDGKVLDIEKAQGPNEPHHEVITRDDEVQIYESIMQDLNGARTIRLIRAGTYSKDNRILPRGWSPDHEAAEHTVPAGGALDDLSFTGGADTTRYEVTVDGEPARVVVDVLYQAVGTRFAMELFQTDTEEVRAFRSMYNRVSNTPELVATHEADL